MQRRGRGLADRPRDLGERYDVVLTNSPFGKKSSYCAIGEDGAVETEQERYECGDFKFTTSNKQLDFMQPHPDHHEFVACYSARCMDQRNESEHFKRLGVADCGAATRRNLDIFWLKDNGLDIVDRLQPPDEIAIQIVENLRSSDGGVSAGRLSTRCIDGLGSQHTKKSRQHWECQRLLQSQRNGGAGGN